MAGEAGRALVDARALRLPLAYVGVFCDVPPGESCIGYPAMLGKEAARNMACLRSLAETTRIVRRLAPKLKRGRRARMNVRIEFAGHRGATAHRPVRIKLLR